MKVTPDTLNSRVEFDVPFTITEDGDFIDDMSSIYVPTVLDEEIDSDSWEFWSTGRSGQFSYNGPVMHNSETLSGGMARDLLAEPGTYVVVACYWEDDENPEGWAVLKLIENG